MSKEELRQDIRNCFKVCDTLDDKYDKRCRELQHDISDLTTDLKLTISTVKSLASGLEKFSDNFDKHNEEEIKRYDEMKLQQSKFIKVFWIASGSLSTVLFVGGVIGWLVNIIISLKGF